MLRTCLLAIMLICFVNLSISQGTQGPCSAVSLPGPYTNPVSVFGSTESAQIDTVHCNSTVNSGIMWFSITPSSGSTVNATTCNPNTNFNTLIYAVTGSCSNPSCVITNNYECTSNQSTVTWIANGQPYLVGVTGYSTSSGKFELTISETPTGNVTSCQTALILPGPYTTPTTVYGNNGLSTGYPIDVCYISGSTHSDWYIINPTFNTIIEVSTCFSTTSFDTAIGVLSGNCNALVCNYSNDNNCTTGANGKASGLSFLADLPTYYIVVSGVDGGSGAYELRIQSQSQANTGCINAFPIAATLGSISYFENTVSSPPLPPNLPLCGAQYHGPAFWYVVSGQPSTLHATVTTCAPDTNYDTVLIVYEGTCDHLTCIVENNDASCAYQSNQSTVSWTVTPPTTYYVVVTGYSGQYGNFYITFTFQ